ncbi:hypothetical protein [Candidatus Thiosymbion oneisti]|uniref:hypothetical protein n=1 Tax=Candidatus Thiosymbion oneisti TaxID=589554 RepID=UPI000B7E70AF|nr:hypothetical protein [Candidatus Thiosymbion oneisti]
MTEEIEKGKSDLTEKNNGTEQESHDSAPKEPKALPEPELLKNLPPEARKVVEIGMMSARRFGPMPNPLTDKITEKHIDKILEIAAKDDERSFKDTAQSRKFTLLYIVIFVALFTFLTVFLVGADKDLYKEAIKLFAVFLGGFGGGFGVKSYMDRNK